MNESSSKELIIIAGPTASGKTAAAVALAKKIGGEVVTADSMQVYRGMDIGTAKPAPEERGGIPHHMIDVVEPTEKFSAFDYQRMAAEVIADIHARGKVPILSGGTGFYINAVLYGNNFEERAEFSVRPDNAGSIPSENKGKNYELLKNLDPDYAASVHPNNARRVARALDFYYATGKKLSEHNREQKQNPPLYGAKFFILDVPREELYRRIDERALHMFERGLVGEVRGLMNAGCHPGLTSMQGIGYKETAAYIAGKCSIEEAVEEIQKNTRHYAKRQVTWFKRQAPGAVWINTSFSGWESVTQPTASHWGTKL